MHVCCVLLARGSGGICSPKKICFFELLKVGISGHFTSQEGGGGGNRVTKVEGRANTPHFVSPQINHSIPDSSLAFCLQYELEI